MSKTAKLNNWNKTDTAIFWGEIAPSDHVLQIYENDETFINTLAGFVGTGINSGDCSVVIATPSHIIQLEQKLQSLGLNIRGLIDDVRYMPLDAEETLSKFMVNNWPDPKLFHQTINGVIEKGTSNHRGIRAFGEMVAILWAQGHCGATVQLEALWNDLIRKRSFPLFCAYPKTGFTQDLTQSMNDICCNHSRMISNPDNSLTDILYADLSLREAV